MITISNIPVFLFYLVDAQGRSYYVENGVVKVSGLPRPLEWSPDGWQDMAIGWERNLEKMGLIRNFSMSLRFLGDGALILEWLYYRKNIDEKVWLLIQRLDEEVTPFVDQANPGTFDHVHKFFYKGEIDLSTFRWSRRHVQVNIMEGGRAQEIQANEGTPFEYDLAAPETIRVKLDGIPFQQNGNYSTPDDLQISNKNYAFFAFPMTLISTEGTATGAAFGESMLENVGNVANYTNTSQNYPITVDQNVTNNPITFTAKGTLRWIVERNDINGSMYLLFRTNTGVEKRINASGGDPTNAVGSIRTMDINYTFTLQPGEKMYYLGHIGNPLVPGATEFRIRFLSNSFMSVSYSNERASSFIRMYKGSDLFRAMIAKVCGSADYAVSDLLSQLSYCWTSGDGIRGLQGAKIKETLKNLFLFYRAEKCAGLGVEEGKVLLELWTRWFDTDPANIVDLGEVKDLQIEDATDYRANAYKVGYPDQNYDDVNGRFEFNSEQVYSAPPVRAAKTWEIVSPIRADVYGIEFTRINLDGKSTTDSAADNDTFVINVDLDNPLQDADGVYYLPKKANYTTIAGVPYPPKTYNIEGLTPKRMLIDAWGSFIRGMQYGFESGTIKFASATKNKDLKTTGGPGGDFDEGADVPVKSLAAPRFRPQKLTFTALSPLVMQKAIREKPGRLYRLHSDGLTFLGFFIKGGIKSRTNQEQSFVLLSDTTNDFTKLENS